MESNAFMYTLLEPITLSQYKIQMDEMHFCFNAKVEKVIAKDINCFRLTLEESMCIDVELLFCLTVYQCISTLRL